MFAAAAALLAAAVAVQPDAAAESTKPSAPRASETVAAAGSPIQVYGTWHCSDDACAWATVRDMTDFDTDNHWLIDRGDGSPSVNLVVLSFVNLKQGRHHGLAQHLPRRCRNRRTPRSGSKPDRMPLCTSCRHPAPVVPTC